MLFLFITGALAKFTIPDVVSTFLPGICIAWICSSVWAYFDTPDTYILNQVLYTKEEDDFIYHFNAELAAQAEKERYLYLVNGKYCMVNYNIPIPYVPNPHARGSTTAHPELQKMLGYGRIVKKESLVLTVKNNIAHLHGDLYTIAHYADGVMIHMVNITLPNIFHTEHLRYVGQIVPSLQYAYVGPAFLEQSKLYIPGCGHTCECVKISGRAGTPTPCGAHPHPPTTRTVYCHIDMHFQVQI